MTDAVLQGRVLSNRSAADVQVSAEGGRIRCRALGKLRETGLLPGDLVTLRREPGGEGTILSVLPRKNRFARPAVANVDRLLLVVSAAPPATGRAYIDGMCAMAAYMGAETVLCLNKTDRHPGEELAAVYRAAGYPVLPLSAETGEGVDALSEYLKDGLTVFAGNSGVGKSSLLNRVLQQSAQATGELSRKIGRGRNTTRHAELYFTRFGGVLCDTPGFSTFDPVEMGMTDPDRLFGCFPEFAPYYGKCRYSDCGHTAEEGCALIGAVAQGQIDPERHASYAALWKQLRAYQKTHYSKKS